MLLIHIIIQITPYSFNIFMSDATNDSVNNLPSEEDAGSIKLQRLDESSEWVMYNSHLLQIEEETKSPLIF